MPVRQQGPLSKQHCSSSERVVVAEAFDGHHALAKFHIHTPYLTMMDLDALKRDVKLRERRQSRSA